MRKEVFEIGGIGAYEGARILRDSKFCEECGERIAWERPGALVRMKLSQFRCPMGGHV